MRFSVAFLGRLAVLAVAGLGVVACAPAGAQSPAQVMRSEAGVSSCEVVTVVHTRMYWSPLELKDADAMASHVATRMKEDAGRAGANFLHVDGMNVPSNEATGTAYKCPSTFKADLRSADVAFVEFDGSKRRMNLPAETPAAAPIAPAAPPPPAVVAEAAPVSTTTTTAAAVPAGKSAGKTAPATAAASGSAESAKPTKKKGAGAATAAVTTKATLSATGAATPAAAKKKPAAAKPKKDPAKDPSLAFNP